VGLTLVATPLGNLRDITLRALDVLRECDFIAAEDTRVARRLLSALGLPGKPMLSYREANAEEVTQPILEHARKGEVALVCDAGTPAISDPGRALVAAARAAGIPVTAAPGPVAFVDALVLSGFDSAGLVFRGFLPRTASAKRSALEAGLRADGPTAWYESPHRIVATLETLAALAPKAELFVARELTKLHEQQVLGTATEVLAQLERQVRGEIVLVLAPQPAPSAPLSDAEVDRAIDALLAEGKPVTTIAKALAEESGSPRGVVYARVVARKRARGD
jgi:16S rRNA (cytidine1402-2'-O)-methyltransferase